MIDDIDSLARLSLDAHLLANCVSTQGIYIDGRAWERSVCEILMRPEFDRRQNPGQGKLFELSSLSGMHHELDFCMNGWNGLTIIECKAKRGGLDKGDIASFDLKVFDYYFGNIEVASKEKWWVMLISAFPPNDLIRRLCFELGIILCDSEVLPLPIIFKLLKSKNADSQFSKSNTSLAEEYERRFCCSIQKQWRFSRQNLSVYHPPSSRELDSLLNFQYELSQRIRHTDGMQFTNKYSNRRSYLNSRLQVIAAMI